MLADARREWQKATDAAVAAFADRDAALERLGVVLAERDQLARLHEVATERVVAAAAVIRLAKDVATGLSADANTYKTGRLLWDLLASADTDAALREVRAKAFDEGAESVAAVLDVTHGVPNPYREGAKTDG